MIRTREVHLKRYPRGVPTPEDFAIVETELDELGEGDVLVENTWMSVDPYMRGRMRPGPSYVAAFRPGRALDGGTIKWKETVYEGIERAAEAFIGLSSGQN